MNLQNKIYQCIGIPHTALISIILFLMILSFPIGAYLVFNSEIGDDITYEYPMNDLNVFLAGVGFQVPVEFELGDGFIVLWCLFLILFAVAIFGPKKNFVNVLQSIISAGKYHQLRDNYIITAIKWFSILVVVSGVIISVQEFFGISVEKIEAPNQLIQFFQLLLAPLIEEIGFRVILIGLPLFALYSYKSSFRLFVKSLWRPSHHLRITDLKKPLLIIIIVGIFFGVSHVITGETWSAGKFAQATVSGLIIGWVYFRYGLAPAILIHWATNYFIYSYAYIVADINKIPVETAFTHSLLYTLELMLIATGVISIVILALNYIFLKKRTLEA
ncbi:MAG: CPBP family intramembrane metalloprotease domain-containing protein [Thaumarchaeota archaeon]|nr:MAG: CPBP family intramembrane metalloprotease domain-containing protein [Nitrososphaerota archaeon]